MVKDQCRLSEGSEVRNNGPRPTAEVDKNAMKVRFDHDAFRGVPY